MDCEAPTQITAEFRAIENSWEGGCTWPPHQLIGPEGDERVEGSWVVGYHAQVIGSCIDEGEWFYGTDPVDKGLLFSESEFQCWGFRHCAYSDNETHDFYIWDCNASQVAAKDLTLRLSGGGETLGEVGFPLRIVNHVPEPIFIGDLGVVFVGDDIGMSIQVHAPGDHLRVWPDLRRPRGFDIDGSGELWQVSDWTPQSEDVGEWAFEIHVEDEERTGFDVPVAFTIRRGCSCEGSRTLVLWPFVLLGRRRLRVTRRSR